MNTAVISRRASAETRQHEHPPEQVLVAHPTVASRVGLLDRLALHLGVALITWGRRTLASESYQHKANLRKQNLAGRERELATERMRLLSAPRL